MLSGFPVPGKADIGIPVPLPDVQKQLLEPDFPRSRRVMDNEAGILKHVSISSDGMRMQVRSNLPPISHSAFSLPATFSLSSGNQRSDSNSTSKIGHLYLARFASLTPDGRYFVEFICYAKPTSSPLGIFESKRLQDSHNFSVCFEDLNGDLVSDYRKAAAGSHLVGDIDLGVEPIGFKANKGDVISSTRGSAVVLLPGMLQMRPPAPSVGDGGQPHEYVEGSVHVFVRCVVFRVAAVKRPFAACEGYPRPDANLGPGGVMQLRCALSTKSSLRSRNNEGTLISNLHGAVVLSDGQARLMFNLTLLDEASEAPKLSRRTHNLEWRVEGDVFVLDAFVMRQKRQSRTGKSAVLATSYGLVQVSSEYPRLVFNFRVHRGHTSHSIAGIPALLRHDPSQPQPRGAAGTSGTDAGGAAAAAPPVDVAAQVCRQPLFLVSDPAHGLPIAGSEMFCVDPATAGTQPHRVNTAPIGVGEVSVSIRRSLLVLKADLSKEVGPGVVCRLAGPLPKPFDSVVLQVYIQRTARSNAQAVPAPFVWWVRNDNLAVALSPPHLLHIATDTSLDTHRSSSKRSDVVSSFNGWLQHPYDSGLAISFSCYRPTSLPAKELPMAHALGAMPADAAAGIKMVPKMRRARARRLVIDLKDFPALSVAGSLAPRAPQTAAVFATAAAGTAAAPSAGGGAAGASHETRPKLPSTEPLNIEYLGEPKKRSKKSGGMIEGSELVRLPGILAIDVLTEEDLRPKGKRPRLQPSGGDKPGLGGPVHLPPPARLAPAVVSDNAGDSIQARGAVQRADAGAGSGPDAGNAAAAAGGAANREGGAGAGAQNETSRREVTLNPNPPPADAASYHHRYAGFPASGNFFAQIPAVQQTEASMAWEHASDYQDLSALTSSYGVPSIAPPTSENIRDNRKE